MDVREIKEKVDGLHLQVGDRVKVTNWIRHRLHLEIVPTTFGHGPLSNVRVVDTGEIATIGRAELDQWLAQEDTEVERRNAGQ